MLEFEVRIFSAFQWDFPISHPILPFYPTPSDRRPSHRTPRFKWDWLPYTDLRFFGQDFIARDRPVEFFI